MDITIQGETIEELAKSVRRSVLLTSKSLAQKNNYYALSLIKTSLTRSITKLQLLKIAVDNEIQRYDTENLCLECSSPKNADGVCTSQNGFCWCSRGLVRK